MPIGAPSQRPEPKSGCSPVERPIDAISCAEFAATGQRVDALVPRVARRKDRARGRARQRQRAGGRAAERECRGAEHRQPSHADGCLVDRQRDRHRRSLALAALEIDGAAVLLDDRAHDHEPEPRAGNRLPRRGRCAEEAGEELALLVDRDADAGVGDGDPRERAVLHDADRHRAAGVGELDRVRDQIVEHLREPVGVRAHGRSAVELEAEVDFALGRARPRRLDRGRRDVVEADVGEHELEPVRLDLRDEQQILDEPLEPVGAAADHVEVHPARLAEARLLVAEHLEKAGDGRQRRAQLVRHGGDERVAEPVELTVRRDLAERPDPSAEAAVRVRDRRGVAAEDAAAALELELVLARLHRMLRDVAHPDPVALGLGRARRNREQPLADGSFRGHPELDAEPAQRRVRDQQIPRRVRQAHAVLRRVDERRLKRELRPVRPLALAHPPADDARADGEERRTRRSGSRASVPVIEPPWSSVAMIHSPIPRPAAARPPTTPVSYPIRPTHGARPIAPISFAVSRQHASPRTSRAARGAR